MTKPPPDQLPTESPPAAPKSLEQLKRESIELGPFSADELRMTHGQHFLCSMLWRIEHGRLTHSQAFWLLVGRMPKPQDNPTNWLRAIFREWSELQKTLPCLLPDNVQ